MILIKNRADQNQVFLTGFMGTGKTETGRILAGYLDRQFIDTDQLVEKAAGLKIPLIFEKHGEEYFRDLESKVLSSLADYKSGNLVVATGGGAVLRAENRRLLKELGLVFLLRASAEEIYRRTAATGNRPLLNASDPYRTITAMLKARESCYRDCDYVIDTTTKTPRQVAAAILSCLNSL